MRLEVRCEETDHVLYRNGSSLGQRQVEWNFTVAEEVEGNYECRWPNGSVFESRRVEVDGETTACYCMGSTSHSVSRTRSPGGVYIVPDADRDSLAGQSCKQVTADVECSRSGRSYQFNVQAEDAADHREQFHVLGSRPISLAVEVLWVNHYPVDLQPQWRSIVDNTTSLHVRMYHTATLCAVTSYS